MTVDGSWKIQFKETCHCALHWCVLGWLLQACLRAWPLGWCSSIELDIGVLRMNSSSTVTNRKVHQVASGKQARFVTLCDVHCLKPLRLWHSTMKADWLDKKEGDNPEPKTQRKTFNCMRACQCIQEGDCLGLDVTLPFVETGWRSHMTPPWCCLVCAMGTHCEGAHSTCACTTPHKQPWASAEGSSAHGGLAHLGCCE